MATTDDTFDPNDLESIDALLDEAELEAVSDLPTDDDLTESFDEMASLQDIEESLAEENAEDDLIDSIDDLVANNGDEPEVVAVSEPLLQEEMPVGTDIPPMVDVTPKPKAEAVEDIEDFFSKRASAKASKNSNIAAEDMDSIKKLIIIFGSILSILVLVGIGIGVWGALAASSAGLDEDTQTLIESIKVSTEQSGLVSESAEKTAKSVEKKIDAINFQLEQLVADIGQLDGKSIQGKNEIIDPVGLSTLQEPEKQGNQTPVAVAPPVAHVATPLVAQNNELMDKVSSVNKKIISAQRRIDEVNNRVKKIQAQYSSLIHSVKTVEKQVLTEQAEKAEKAELEKQKQSNNQYQYTAPDGGFYDQSVTDSYP